MSRLTLHGKCRAAADQSRRGNPRASSGFHGACPGQLVVVGTATLKCECPCHAAAKRRPSLEEAVRAARRERMVAAGVDPDAPARGRGDRRFCRHDHEMTEDNTGPRGECRTCKREASARCKARKKVAA